jgi:hypothetical protein
MTMNLIQIQDRLKGLPNDPRVMQMLTAYANGQNPQVPPYLALGELNRRKVLIEQQQAAAAGQPPGGTVKDQIQQQTGVMALKQGQQQQAMQRMAQQGGIAGPVPQNIPQPEAQAEAPVMAAAGGLASLAPKGYRSGGIIAFQEAGSVNDAVEKKEEEEKYPTNPQEMYELMARKALQEINRKPPKREDFFDRQARLIKENPEMLGALAKPIGQDAIARLDQLQEARRAELAKQKEELAASKPGILQLLGQAAMGSRGQQGSSALASILGGYSDLSSGAQAKQLQQEQALRMKELDLQQAKADVLSKVEEAQRAYAAGNMTKAEAYIKEGEDIANKHGTSMRELLGKQLSTASQQVVSKDATTQAILDRDQRRLDERLNREARAKEAANRIADRPFNAIQVQYELLKTGDPKKDADLLQRLVKENSEVKKPGLDETKLNAFNKANDAMLTQLRREKMLADKNPKDYQQKYQNTLRTLRQAAENRGLDPDSIPDLVAGGVTPVESPGAPPPGAVREVKK